MSGAIAAAVALAFAAALSRTERLAQPIAVAVWIALLAVFGVMQQGLWLTSTAIVLAMTLGALAAFPVSQHRGIRKQAVWALPTVLMPLGLLGGDAPIVDGHFVVLIAATFAAILAGVTLFAGAMTAAGARSAGIASVGAFSGALLLGVTRSPVGSGFQVPLASESGPLFWELPSMEPLPEGVRIVATVAAPSWLLFLGVGAAVLGVVSCVAMAAGKKKPATFAGLSGALLGVVALWAMGSFSASTLPDATPYVDYTRLILQKQRIDPIGAEAARFLSASDIHVDVAAMMPDLALWLLGTLLLLLSAGASYWDAKCYLPASRDLAIRGVVFLWLGWFLSVFFHASYLGALGMHGAGEWVFLGLTLVSTASVMIGWRLKTRLGAIVSTWAPGIIVGLWILLAALAWVFQALPGVSVTLG